MRVKKFLKKYFIPHPENDHKPHFLRLETVLGILIGVLSVEALFLATIFIVFPRSSFFASLIPDVLVDLTNQNRSTEHIAELSVNPVLVKAAQLKADDMAAKGYFAHTSPEGVTPWHWLDEAGYRYARAGENLAVDFTDSKDVVTAWMNSPGHRANIENGNFTEIGIATAKGMLDGRETTFVAQFFGKPAFIQEPIPETKPVVVAVVPEVPSVPKPLAEKVRGAAIVPEEPLFRDTAVTVVPPQSEASAPTVVDIKPTAPAPAPRSTFMERAVTAPRGTANVIFITLLTVVATALVLTVAIKIKIQHPQLILHGILLIFVVSSLILANRVLAEGVLRIQ